MKKITKRVFSLLLCVIMLTTIVTPVISPVTKAATVDHYSSYSTITEIKNYNGCTGMQGMAIDGNYIYSVKINSSTEASAFIARTHKDTGSTVYMTDSSTGSAFFSYLSHANDLEVATIAGKTNLFVATSLDGSYSLVRYEINGTKLTKIGNYSAVYNGSEIAFSSAKVMSADDSQIKLLCKKGKYLYYATLGVNATGGTFELTNRFTLDVTDVVINGVSRDLSEYLHQGFEYIDNKIFVPITGYPDMSISIIAVYDIEGVSGTVKNDPSLSFEIVSTSYPNKCEIESCAISPLDGRLYFNTNRAVTSSNADHDGLHYFTNYVYDPTQGDSAEPDVYRWEVNDDRLQSSTTGGSSYNGAVMHAGSISDGEFTNAQYYVDQAVVLKHDRPWIVEWKSSGSWGNGGLLFSANSISKYNGNTFIFRRQNSTLIAIGEYTGGQYNNYGLDVSDYGIDASKEHVYSLRNHIAADGSNMVYVYVDGKELGPMNNYYLAGSDQGTKSNWLSGKDFAFSYIGTDLHPITDCSVEYIQVWGNGASDRFSGPEIQRWETKNNALTAVNTYGLTGNAATVLTGSCKGGVYSGTQVGLQQDVILLHDRPWSFEWQCEGAWTGGSRFVAAGETSRCVNAPFIYRQDNSGIIAFGYYTGSQFNHYGIKLSDHGIDGTAPHVYRLTNRIEADGSNMIYLYVDGVELGAMNHYYVGHTDKGTTSDWVSGRDFTFSYFGTYQHGITDVSFGYLQFWENGIPAEDTPDNYRWETQNNTLTDVTTGGYAENEAHILSGSITNGVFSGSYAVLDRPVVLLHDRQWSVSWQSEGNWKDAQNGAMLLASSNDGNAANTVYLYRRGSSELIALGHRYNSKHHNYGIKLSDYGIDGTASHTYQLTNRINSDGSNMVYLSVDGVELGAMNNYYVGGASQGTTDNWVSGKDFVFPYMGTENFTIGNCSIEYVQINEGCTHSYGNWVTVNATCMADGVKTRTCSICGSVETEMIPAAGHSWNDATCTQAKTCAVCGETEGKAQGHSYKSETTAPTCTENGRTTYTCTGCGDSYIEIIAASGHKWNDATCTTAKTCSVCGETEGEALDHNYEAVVKAPTCTKSGYTTYICTGCGDSYIGDVVPATGHTWSDGICGSCGTICEHSYQNGTCTVCGDKVAVVEDSKDIKWQVTSGTNADSASTNLRLLTWVDTLEDYSSVSFNVTINGKTTRLECTTVYTAILASGVAIRNPANVFKNESANYFVTYTLKNIPSSAFDTPIVVTVTWTDLQGNETTSESKTIVISSDWT